VNNGEMNFRNISYCTHFLHTAYFRISDRQLHRRNVCIYTQETHLL